jgi:N-acetyl-anhydromuramyl-L-alanine amidase AmpD
MAWNPNVPNERRFNGKMTLGRSGPPTHVVCHITGTNSFTSVKKEFLSAASAHYVVDKDGLLFQFVEEENQAWHSGIKSTVQAQYNKPGTGWRKLLYHFDWAKYPADTVWVDGNLNPVHSRPEATFAMKPDGSEWTDYDYFKNRWGNAAGPLNYAVSKRPNDYGIAIEILSVGAKTASASAYTPAMYATLSALVTDICIRHGIPQEKGRVCGHEDVNPVQRYGWDPNQGFDWTQVW